MSIFSTIKYQISDIPTQEELNNLPQDVVLQWCDFVLKNNNKSWYSTAISVGVLRLMIYDIDENVDEN